MDAVADGLPAAYFHDESGAVRFWVRIADGSIVGATIGKATLHYRLHADIGGADAPRTWPTKNSSMASFGDGWRAARSSL